MPLQGGPPREGWHFAKIFFLVLLAEETLFSRLCQPVVATVGVQATTLLVAASGWPQEAEELQSYQFPVTSAVCSSLDVSRGLAADTDDWCVGFFTPAGSDQLTLNLHAETATVQAFVVVSTVFRRWAEGDASKILWEITNSVNKENRTTYAPPRKLSGSYSAPCRSGKTAEMLPLCSSSNNCKTVLSIEGLGEGATEFLCRLVPRPCETYVRSEEVWGGRTEITIEGVRNSMEVAIYFVGAVREGVLSAKRIELVQNSRAAQLYAEDELNKYEYNVIDDGGCDGGNDLWLLLIAVPVLLLLFGFRCIFSLGRRAGKQMERDAIIDDEVRGGQSGAECRTVRPSLGFGFMDSQCLNNGEGGALSQPLEETAEMDYAPQFTPACTEGGEEAAPQQGDTYIDDNEALDYVAESPSSVGFVPTDRT